MAKKPKMAMQSKIKIPNKEIPEIDAEVKKPKAKVAKPRSISQEVITDVLNNPPKAKPELPPLPKVIQPTKPPKVPWTPERQHGAVMSKIMRDEARKTQPVPKASPKLSATLGMTPKQGKTATIPTPKARPIPMAKPVGKITPRVESRLRVTVQPKQVGDIAVRGTTLPSPSLKGLRNRGPIPVTRAPAVIGPRGVATLEKPIVGGLSKIGGAIEPTGSALGTANATGSAIRGSSKLFGKLGGIGRGLGWVAASMVPNEKFQTGVNAAFHASSARELAKFGAKAALGQVAKKSVPLVGTAFAAAEIANAGIEGYRAVKSQSDAQSAAERSAVKYASPLVHQQFLRARTQAAMNKGAMPDSTKTGAPPYKFTAATPAKSKAGRSGFGTAFSLARKSGQKEFVYKGKSYNTNIASEPTKVSKSIGQAQESFTPSYDSQSFVKTLSPAERSANNVVRAEPAETLSPPKKSFKIGFGRFLRAHSK